MDKNISKEIERMELEDRIHVIRQDLTGDPLLSGKLVKAALKNQWEEVERLLSEGADPRICRAGDAYGVESALYYALIAKRYDIAEKLYDAGDRLDDLITEDEDEIRMSTETLTFLAFSMRDGNNYFLDESKNLPECCRCSAFVQIEQLMPQASPEELNQSIAPTVHSWIRHFKNPEVYNQILEDLLARGAKLSDPEKQELLDDVHTRFHHYCPKVLYPGKEAEDKLISLIKRA